MDETKRCLVLLAVLALLGTVLLTNTNVRAFADRETDLAASSSSLRTGAVAKRQMVDLAQTLPLAFEENRGQTDARVKFLARGKGYTVFLTPTEVALAIRDGKANRDQTIVRMRLMGASHNSPLVGREPLPGTVNYFLGADRAKWRTNLPTYAKVQSHAVAPGVDVIYYGTQGNLEFDLVVAPSTHPGTLTLALEGAQGVRRNAHGDLLLKTATGALRLHRPRVYQELRGMRVERPARYILRRPATALPNRPIRVGIRVAAYDPTRPLIIDPVISYSTYLGGSADDRGISISLDGGGNAYLTGVTSSANFPTATPLQATIAGFSDVFVTKINAAGSAIIYSTYLGGALADQGNGIAVDAQGNAYITGQTSSSDFPTVNSLQAAGGNSDAFVTKLNPSGSALVYSTYLGGGKNDFGVGIAVDAAGNAYVTGVTNSSDFPTTNPVQVTLGGGFDAFVAQLNPTGSALVYSTYLGGSGDENNVFVDNIDMAGGIAVDSGGNAYVAGETESTDFPVANALQATLNGCCDAFVTKLAPGGASLVYSTYLGGSLFDLGRGIAVDPTGNVYVTGQTQGPDFPTVNPQQAAFGGGSSDAFVTKLNPAGSALVYSTYLGGIAFDRGLAIAVNANGSAFVAGETTSPNFPMVDAPQPNFGGGGDDAFVANYNTTGMTLTSSTYLGGSDADRALGVAVDSASNTYVTGDTSSGNFPTNNLQRVSGGGSDAFVTKLGPPISENTSKSSCFIATAAYGSAFDPHVQALRDFRDRYLMRNAVGRVMVNLYYTYSPPAAAVITGHPGLKLAARTVLTPIVYAINYPLGAGLVAFTAVVMSRSVMRTRRQRKNKS